MLCLSSCPVYSCVFISKDFALLASHLPVVSAPVSAAGLAVLVARGACSFADKAATLLAANVTLAIVYNNAPGASVLSSTCSSAEASLASFLQPAALATMSERVLRYHAVKQERLILIHGESEPAEPVDCTDASAPSHVSATDKQTSQSCGPAVSFFVQLQAAW